MSEVKTFVFLNRDLMKGLPKEHRDRIVNRIKESGNEVIHYNLVRFLTRVRNANLVCYGAVPTQVVAMAGKNGITISEGDIS